MIPCQKKIMQRKSDMNDNPYVGPRSFQIGEHLYGREEEILELFDLLIAERIVLLHSPSGAGKTSLIQAGLIPKLKQKRFQVLPTMRVSSVAPATLPPPYNRFILSLLLALEEELPLAQQRSFAELATLHLADYLAQWPPSRDHKVFIIDQFEEILTLDPYGQAAKVEFFKQLGELLTNRKYWALFALREEYVAALETYCRPIPTRLNNTFRLNLLTPPAALDAIRQPAQQTGVNFTDAAAQQLVDNLCQVMVQQADGSSVKQRGNVIEPVQLQVVCRRLWTRLAEETQTITAADILAIGDVDNALADYYASQVTYIARKNAFSERLIRAWCQNHLLTEQGIRGQVLQSPRASQGLNNTIIWQLVDTHLLRAEKRRGATWFELAHDRLVQPIQQNNTVWLHDHLNPLQQQASLWEKQHRTSHLLLQDQPLKTAHAWARSHSDILTSVEKQFLRESQIAQTRLDRQRRQHRWLQIISIMATITSLIAIWFYIKASIQTEKIFVRDLSTQAQLQSQDRPQLSVLLALEVVSHARLLGRNETAAAEEMLRQALETISGIALSGHQNSLSALAFSPDERWLVTGGHTVRLWDLIHPDPLRSVRILWRDTTAVQTLTFSPNGAWLAVAYQDNAVRLWHMDALDSPPQILRGHSAPVLALAFKPDNRELATGSADSHVRLWDLTQMPPQNTKILEGHNSLINKMSWGNSWLMTASLDNTLRLWDTEPTGPHKAVLVLQQPGAWLTHVVFSADQRWIAAADRKGSISLWDTHLLEHSIEPVISFNHQNITDLAFSPKNHWLALASHNTVYLLSLYLFSLEDDYPGWESVFIPLPIKEKVTAFTFFKEHRLATSESSGQFIYLWDLNTIRDKPDRKVILRGHTPTTLLVSSNQGRWLAAIGADNTVRLWDNLQPTGMTESIILSGHQDTITALIFNEESTLLATGSQDHTVRIWNLKKTNQMITSYPISGHKSPINLLVFSPDSQWLASSSEDHQLRVWHSQLATGSSSIPISDAAPHATLSALAFNSEHQLWVINSQPPQERSKEVKYAWRQLHLRRITPLTINQVNHYGAKVTSATFTRFDQLLINTIQGEVESLTLRAAALIPLHRWLLPPKVSNLAIKTKPELEEILLKQHAPEFAVQALSGDGHWLATQEKHGERQVLLWSLQPGEAPIISKKLFAPDSITALALNASGQWLATGSPNGIIYLWDLKQQTVQPIKLFGHTDTVTYLTFSQDNRWLASGSADTTARLWPVSIDKLFEQGCRTVGRNLTSAEWAQYLGQRKYRRTCEAY